MVSVVTNLFPLAFLKDAPPRLSEVTVGRRHILNWISFPWREKLQIIKSQFEKKHLLQNFVWPRGSRGQGSNPQNSFKDQTSNVTSKSLHARKKLQCYPKFPGSKSAFGHLKVVLNDCHQVSWKWNEKIKDNQSILELRGNSLKYCSREIFHPQWCWRPSHWLVRPFFGFWCICKSASSTAQSTTTFGGVCLWLILFLYNIV